MSFWQYLLARLLEPSTMSAITALATGIAASVNHPMVQAIAGTVATAAGIAAILTTEGNGSATVAKLVAGGVQGAASAVAANAQGNDLNVPQTVVAGVAGAVTGVAQAAGPAPSGQTAGAHG